MSRDGISARYHADRTRGRSWSVLPAYTLENGLTPPSGVQLLCHPLTNLLEYLPCTAIKEGYNTDENVDWIINEILPQCNLSPTPRSDYHGHRQQPYE